ncbi:MAG: hypothetical protein JWO60_190 [Frankiales bacterium]|nr:hypothetical protein [Frankiales bacterium]
MPMAASRGRTAALSSVVVFALAFVLLAPARCVGYCEDFDETGVDGRCLSSCTTLLGYGAPMGQGWSLVPVLLVGLLLLRRRRHGR